MKKFTPQQGQLLSWADVKDWLDSMDEKELAQPAFIYRSNFVRIFGQHSTEEQIIGTTTKKLNTGFETPRLIGETANF